MKKNIYFGIAAVIVVLVGFAFYMRGSGAEPQVSLPGDLETPTFSGEISAVDTGCFVDAICSVTVDGKKVVLMTGGIRMNPDQKVGRLLGVESIGDLEMKIGNEANVYATTTPEGDYTIYGDEKYYVEVTGEKK